jgi:hypothetical protein
VRAFLCSRFAGTSNGIEILKNLCKKAEIFYANFLWAKKTKSGKI